MKYSHMPGKMFAFTEKVREDEIFTHAKKKVREGGAVQNLCDKTGLTF